MPTAQTYDNLVDDLKKYSQRANATVDATTLAEIPRIINRREVALARKLKIQGNQITVTSSMTPLTYGVYAKPINWLDTISINFGTVAPGYNTRKPLLPRSYEYSLIYWPDRTETDEPEYYADYDQEHWLIFPSPSAAYPFEVLYHGTPPLLDDANQTNWLTDHLPDVLLNGCVVDLGNFLGWNPTKIMPFQTALDDSLGQVNMQELLKIVDRATTRRSA
jgi:hypothetical protein